MIPDGLTLRGSRSREPFNGQEPLRQQPRVVSMISYTINVLQKYAKFIGPGVMVSVAYMDPGNYSTAVSAGASYEYKLLFTVLVSNIFAVILQVLCAKLGAVTGLNLAECCRKFLPKWLSVTLYILTEIAIIATDLAEVVGTAISLNILLKIPLTVGVLLTVVDVLVVLAAYNPQGPIRLVRYFEYFVSALVLVVVVCFAVELGKLRPEHPEEIWQGFLPSKELFTETKAIYLSCGILGATVMPHSLYLGSGIVQPRLKDFDIKKGYYSARKAESGEDDDDYQPSLAAINSCMKYTIAELVISLCTVAIFVNSAILIVAGTTMYKTEQAYDADLFSIYDMLVQFLGQAAGTIFALALLFSGQSAGIVCTLAGQMVSEGFISWTVRPWLRRVITRALAIAPCLFVSMFVGRSGLATVLNGSQVVLSLLLPFITAPLIYFTASSAIMRVPTTVQVTENVALQPRPSQDTLTGAGRDTGDDEDSETSNFTPPSSGRYVQLGEEGQTYCDLSNSRWLHWSALLIFLLVSALNLFLIIAMAFE